MKNSDRVTVSLDEGVAHVRLNRADKRNGIDHAMFESLVRAGEAIAADRSVRVVILSGEGPVFCAGLDWKAFSKDHEASRALLARDSARSPANGFQRACWVWTEVPVPVIAAVHGAAVGAGLQLALACDFRFVTPDAKLSLAEIRYGVIPDVTASQTLLRLVRADVAKEMVYTGRIVTGEEGSRIGLATRACADPVAEARDLAHAIAMRSPAAIRAAKKLCDRAPAMDVAAALLLETELQESLLGTPNQMAAAQAAMSGIEVRFDD